MSKTNKDLVEYCRTQLGRPYWMGTFGQIASEAIYNYNRNRPDIAQYYTATDFPKQYGQRVHDCIGLIKGFLWSETPSAAPRYCNPPCVIDHSADSMLAACTEKGHISSIPEISGLLVFYKGHVGVYIGGGEVIEARGHAYGVVKTKLKERAWKNWGKCPYITYIEEEEEVTYEQFKDFMQKYETEVRAKPEPEWSKKEGAWIKATAKGIVNGEAPESPIKRCEVIAVLDRLGSLE